MDHFNRFLINFFLSVPPGFLILSGGVEREQWPEIDYSNYLNAFEKQK